MAPTLATSCAALPRGALRLRPGKAGSAALAGEDGAVLNTARVQIQVG